MKKQSLHGTPGAGTRDMVQVALFAALIVALAFLPFIGYIPLGFTKATTIHIPVIIGSILLGPRKGAFLGAMFGLSSLIKNTLVPGLSSFVFTPLIPVPGLDRGSPWALFICFVPRILGALVVGYVFSYFFTYIVPAITGGESILASTEWAWVAIVIVVVWQACAQTTIIYITGLSSVPEDVYEAGALDGATGWDKFRYITFPLIMPSVTTNMVLVMKDMLMVFDQIVSMTSGGPAQSTESISYLIYNNGLSGGQFGYQCANAVIFFILIAVVSILQTKFLNSKEEQL